MNKELEEAIEFLKYEVTIYDNNEEINKIIGGKAGEKQHKINKIILNYIENSISKEVIEKKIEELKEEKYILSSRDAEIELLQELLEGK